MPNESVYGVVKGIGTCGFHITSSMSVLTYQMFPARGDPKRVLGAVYKKGRSELVLVYCWEDEAFTYTPRGFPLRHCGNLADGYRESLTAAD